MVRNSRSRPSATNGEEIRKVTRPVKANFFERQGEPPGEPRTARLEARPPDPEHADMTSLGASYLPLFSTDRPPPRQLHQPPAGARVGVPLAASSGAGRA